MHLNQKDFDSFVDFISQLLLLQIQTKHSVLGLMEMEFDVLPLLFTVAAILSSHSFQCGL